MTIRPRVFAGDEEYDPTRITVGKKSSGEGQVSAITKWVPVEVIALFEGVTRPFGAQISAAMPWLVVGGVIATFLWIAYATADAKTQHRFAWRQIVLSCVAFLFWVFGTADTTLWSQIISGWQPAFGPVALAIGTFLLPVVDGILKRMGLPQD